jgi:nicotinate phosphoribosyltransferase
MAPSALLTDLYELNMARSYLRRGMQGDATFSLFVRKLPPQRGFLVAAGLEPCLEFLESFSFSDDDLEYLDRELGFEGEVLSELGGMGFHGDVWAVPEGRVVYANEPLLEITAPIAVAQLVEPLLLNQITFQTTIASKAARCMLAADGRDVVDFSLRRTHGLDAAVAVARCSSIVGFSATSNVEAARRYELRPTGTMAHSYIESFPSEKEAFRTFARDFPDRTTFLVDTFDTLNGVRTAIEVISELGLRDRLAVRLDSGDLDELSRSARELLDEAGLSHVRIFASGGLDEFEIDRLVAAGAPIDAFGVGTRMGVSADAPSLDSAYKLVEYDGRPILKLSKDKVTAPGRKQVFRGRGGDTIGLRTEQPPDDQEPLLVPVMLGGERTGPHQTLDVARMHFRTDVEQVSGAARRIVDPVPLEPSTTGALDRLAEQARAEALERAGLAEG